MLLKIQLSKIQKRLIHYEETVVDEVVEETPVVEGQQWKKTTEETATETEE